MTRLDGRYADWILEKWKKDDDPDSDDKMFVLLEDIAAAPLIPSQDISSFVDGGNLHLSNVNNPALSPYQLMALTCLAQGLQVKEIAAKLGCSHGSVIQHLKRARARLRAKSNSHAVALALGIGLFEAPSRLIAEGRFVSTINDRPSPTEARVLERLARGDSNQEIANWLDVSSEYVKDIVSQLFELYGARNRTHLIALAIATDTLRLVSSRHKKKT